MATTLLLEGDDLEALLARAQAEGGPDARIVRAEKIRQGGVLGFFARERFEVALEVPDRHVPGTPAVPAEPTTDGTAPTKGPMMSQPPDRAPGAAFERVARRLVAAADDPRVAAGEGLLGLAERADAAERAAADAASTGEDAVDLALRRLLEQRDPDPVGVPASPVRPSTSRPEFTALLDQLRTTTSSTSPAHASVAAPVTTPVAASVAAPVASWPSSAPRDGVPVAYREAAVPSLAAASPVPAASGTPAAAAAPAGVPPAGAIPAQAGAPTVERHTLGRTRADQAAPASRDRREDPQLAADRRALRALGVPPAWTRRLRSGDRFTAMLRMLDRMPEADIDPATRVVAVVGPAASVLLEAHRTALDLATGPAPRPVVSVPAAAGAERAAALAEARLLGDVVVAIEADGDGQAQVAVEALQSAGAGAVIVVVSAADALERSQAHLDALGQVDALAVEGTGGSAEPAAVLQLGLPVVRLDGIPIDRYTWSAVLCAQLGPVADA